MSNSLKDKLRKRYEDRGKSSTRMQALDFGRKEVTFWRPKKGKNHISILPYIIKTKNHPLVISKDAKIGEEDFMFDVWVHRYVGPSNADIVCLKKNYNRSCPICEQEKIYRDQGNKEEADALRASHRAFYNILDEEDKDKGVQIFQESYKNFQEELINDAGEEGEIVDFVSLKHGKSIKFRAEEEKFGKNVYFEYRSFKFPEREEPIDESIMDDVVSFDECVVTHTYDEIKSIFYGDEEDLKNQENDEDLDEKEEKESSKKNEQMKSKNSRNKDDDHRDDDLDKKESKKCPKGFVFGKDCEQHDECDDCPIWPECFAAKKAMRAKK